MKTLLLSIQKDLDVIGLKSLHYSLLAEGEDSRLLFLPDLGFPDRDIVAALTEFIRNFSPDMIGVSLMSTEYFLAVRLTGLLRQITQVPVVWGGIHPTIAPEDCLRHADFVCRGEGEQALLDMLRTLRQGKDLRTVNNLCYLNDGALVINPLYPYQENLDSLEAAEHLPRQSYIFCGSSVAPLSTRVFRRYARYRGTAYSLMTSRGCPFSCTYCCNNFLFNLYGSKKVRRRSSAHVIAELERAISEHPFITLINFQDDSFLSAPVEAIRDFCQLYRRRVSKPFVVRCIPNSVTKEKVTLLKEAGLAWVSLGLQSGSDRVCKEVYRRTSTRAAFVNAAKVIQELELAAFYDIILDNPFETEADRLETAGTLIETPKPYYAQFYSLTFYLGTELHDRAKKEYPDKIEDYRTKEYLAYDPNKIINNLIRISAYI